MLNNDAIKLTPSEIELLKANPGAENVLFGNLTRKLENGSSTTISLLQRALQAAFLANEDAGLLEYQVVQNSSFFGLRSTTRLAVHAKEYRHCWPSPSLEAQIVHLVERLSRDDRPLTITTLVLGWLGGVASMHFQTALTWIYDALAERGWVRCELEERLNLFCLTRYVIPENTSRLVKGLTNSNGNSTSVSAFITAQNKEILSREVGRALTSMHPAP